MSLHVVIPDPLATTLQERAAQVGVSAEEVALAAIQREFAPSMTLEQLLAPIREAYQESGLTEDESLDFLEAEKHALRRERRAAHK